MNQVLSDISDRIKGFLESVWTLEENTGAYVRCLETIRFLFSSEVATPPIPQYFIDSCPLINGLPAKNLLTGHQAELSIDGLTAALQQKYAVRSPAQCNREAAYNAREALENACNKWLSEKSPSVSKPYIPFTTLTRLEEIARHVAAERFQQRLAENPGELRIEKQRTPRGILAHSNRPRSVLQNPTTHPILGKPHERVSVLALDLATARAPTPCEVAPILLSSMENCRIGGVAQPRGPFQTWAVSTSSQQPGNSAAAAVAATPLFNGQRVNPAEWPEAGPDFGFE